jgi:spermidine synthase
MSDLRTARPPATPALSGWTYAGLFLVALATLTYEILLTRIFSVTMLYHFAFVAISVAMFGMTAGALVVYLWPQWFPPERLARQLSASATAFAVLIVLSFLTQLSVPFHVHPSIVAIYAIGFTYAVIAVPFVASGVCVALALTRRPERVASLYAADLAGAALGCVLLVGLLRVTDAPTAAIALAAVAALAGWCFAMDAPEAARVRRVAAVIAITLVSAAAAHTVLVWRQFPVLRILYIRGAFEARPLYEKWNSYSRVRVNGDPSAPAVPSGWGLSRTLPADRRVRQLQMDIDIGAGTVMTGYTGQPAEIDHLKYDVTNVAYHVRPPRSVLVVGAGGGRDVLSGLAFGAQRITAVEINKDIVRTVNGRFGDFTGHLDRDPRIRFVNDEARSYIARSPEPVDLIQISLIDTWAATAAGAFVLSENSLYTVEAWSLFWRRLTPDGMLSVSRWYFQDRPGEMYRITALAATALRRAGVQNVREHLLIVRNMRLANKPDMPDGVGTLVVSRRPFTEAEIARAEAVSSQLGFDIPLSARHVADGTFQRLTSDADVDAVARAYPLDISAPTDDSPFFFNMLRLRDIFRWSLAEQGKATHNLKAVLVLGVLLATVLLLTAVCIVLPLWMRAGVAGLAGERPLLVYFGAIGLGFMLIETALMQRLIIALGHPTYGLSVVLFGLLLSSGAGSYASRPLAGSPRGQVRCLLALIAALAVLGVLTAPLAAAMEGATTAARIAGAVAVLFPAGFFMGMAFPIGMSVGARRAPAILPWLWGINGATSVLASVLAVCIALTWSISAAFWSGLVCYAAAFAAYRRAAAAGPALAARVRSGAA